MILRRIALLTDLIPGISPTELKAPLIQILLEDDNGASDVTIGYTQDVIREIKQNCPKSAGCTSVCNPAHTLWDIY